MKEQNIVEIKYLDYSAKINLSRGGNCISLRNEKYGAKLLREPDYSTELDNPYLYGMPILFPVNRISGGSFTFENRIYSFPINEPVTGCHLHNQTENISNEWNYVKGWTDEFPYTVEQIHGIKGAVVTMSTMCVAQRTSLDMLMYYDTRPSTFNGVFDFYTAKPLKGYYAFYWYGMFYDMKAEVRAVNEIENIYSLCGVDENGKILAIVTHYSDNDDTENKKVFVDFGKSGEYEIYLLDEEHSGELVQITDKLEFDMKVHSAILIKEK